MRSPVRLFLDAVSDDRLSRQVGRLAALRVPQPLLKAAILAYVRHYAVDLSDAADSLDSYESFNAFFTRRLRDGARPLCEGESAIASPADGTVLSYGALGDGLLRQIKGKDYSLEELLGSREEAERLRGGRYLSVYLSPRDYHRVHSPLDGAVTSYRYIPGKLYPVNQMAVKRVDNLFVVNERLVATMQTEAAGRVVVVLVGATSVGQISVSFDPMRTNALHKRPTERSFESPIALRKGDELGRFNLGSSIVLLVESPHMRFQGLTEGQRVRMGECIMAPAH